METTLKVGALAKSTGLTVRTLHHYDEIGLLTPARRTPSGHRLYAEDDLRRLQHIASLRQLGLSLDEIKSCLDDPGETLAKALELQADRIEDHIDRQRRLRALVLDLRERLLRDGRVSIDELARTIRATTTHAKYFSPGQLRRLHDRREAAGPGRMLEAEQEWATLFADFSDAHAAGWAVDDERVIALAERARGLVEEFTGGHRDLDESLSNMYRAEGPQRVLEPHGIDVDPAVWRYMSAARAALEGRERGG